MNLCRVECPQCSQWLYLRVAQESVNHRSNNDYFLPYGGTHLSLDAHLHPNKQTDLKNVERNCFWRLRTNQQSDIQIQSLTFIEITVQSRLEMYDFYMWILCTENCFFKWCSAFYSIDNFSSFSLCTCTCVLEKRVLCLYNNAIHLAKLKVYKVTVEKHI